MVEPPPGGPIDDIPPRLLAATPDSGATVTGEVRTLRFTFSEKMDRQAATGWLYFFPDQRIRRTKWHGAVEAEVELEEPLPADTTIVVELAARIADAHRVKARTARRYPISTGGAIPSGQLAGVLVKGDSAVTRGVVELYALPTDTLTLADMPLLRRTATDRTGAFVFDWLPVPGGPWLLKAFEDQDGDLRAGESEARRVLPDTLVLTVEQPAAAAAVATLYAPSTPGRLRLPPFGVFGDAGPVVMFTQQVTEADTGWTPQPIARGRANFKAIYAPNGGTVDEVKPGVNRLGAFVDVDGDTAFSAVPAAAVEPVLAQFRFALADSAGDTTGWYLEPLVLVETPAVEPGLDTWFTLPDTTALLVPWPAPAVRDTAAAATDSTAAAADTTGAAVPEDR